MDIDETTLPKDLVRKVNELFHLQESKIWESRAIEIIRIFLELKTLEGGLDALRKLRGNRNGLDDFSVGERIESIEKRIGLITDEIEKI